MPCAHLSHISFVRTVKYEANKALKCFTADNVFFSAGQYRPYHFAPSCTGSQIQIIHTQNSSSEDLKHSMLQAMNEAEI